MGNNLRKEEIRFILKLVSKMGKKEKKKLKLKHKKMWISLVIILLIGLSIGLFFLIQETNKNILKMMKKNYHTYVITTKKANLYNAKKKKIGTIEKKIPLELEEIKIKDTSQKYFKIKDSDYYILYRDVKKQKKSTENTNINHFIITKELKNTKDITLLNQKKKDFLHLSANITLPIEQEDDSYYYTYFLQNTLLIKKEKSLKTNEIKTKDVEATYVSTLYYENIEDSCFGMGCTPTVTFQEHLKLLKENGYYTISEEEYKSFLKGNGKLKEKAIFLLTSSENESLEKIKQENQVIINKLPENSEITYNPDNKKSLPGMGLTGVDCYHVKSYTTNENMLLMAQGEDVYEIEPSQKEGYGNQKIAVLNYHFFYDPELGEECNEVICLTVQRFRQHLDWLRDNGYKTLTMNEFVRWMYGQIELPEKSVLITVDDGAMGTGTHNGNKLNPLLEEYQMRATLFLIAGWWDIENYRSPNLDIQSHTYDMHLYGTCGRGQINCATYEKAVEDLQKSLAIIGNNDSFCFPFYMTSDTSIQAVKDTGFKVSFVGGNRKANRYSNKYLIPRYPIQSDITLQEFINMVS